MIDLTNKELGIVREALRCYEYELSGVLGQFYPSKERSEEVAVLRRKIMEVRFEKENTPA